MTTSSGAESDEEIKARIHRNAARFAEANVYTMNNPYLTRPQKVLVEAWFQFPIGVFGYLLMAYLAIYSYRYFDAFIFALIAAGVVSLISRYVYFPDGLLIGLGMVFASVVEKVVSVGFMLYFLYHGAYGAAAIALASAVGVLSIIAPSMYLYAVLRSPRTMHFKYGFAKSRFGIAFPFEARE